MPLTSPTSIATQDTMTLAAVRTSGGPLTSRGPFSWEVHSGMELVASMTKSLSRQPGKIDARDCKYQVNSATLLQGCQEIATYRLFERFMWFARVELNDCASRRTFSLRLKRMCSSKLVLFEDGQSVAELLPNLFRSNYRVVAQRDTPELIVLLSIWLAVSPCVFSA